MLGWYVFKYSDDNGQTWSKERYRLPVRRTACDEDNGLEGRTQIFWGIDKPMIYNGDVYFAFTKLGRYMLDLGEGWLFRSTNILTESDPAKIRWEMLPEGEHGIRAERFGSVQEEHNLVGLSNNTLFCMYRTTTGRPCHTYSLDGGRNWLPPEHATYSPGGKKFKHNRACPAVWQAKNGKYLFWFNHHGGRTFNERNPVWLSGGIEKNGRIHWSQPEIALYDPDGIPVRISYPDLIEQDGRVWISQTQKSVARVNEIDPALLEGLWTQGKRNRAATDGLVLDLKEKVIERGGVPAPELPNLTTGDGFSVDFWIRLDGPAPRQTILDTRDDREKGVHLLVIQNSQGASVRIRLNDGTTQYSWDADPGSLAYGTWHHVAIIVDGGPKVLSYVIDGVVNDGGTVREHGWGRIPNSLGNLNAAKTVTLAPTLNGKLKRLRVYNRFLRTSEAIANYHAGH